jgi:formylglycine-generating enzyme required for sulfatase activity
MAMMVAAGSAAQADVFHMPPGLTSLEMVTVGNPGNAGELSGSSAGGYGPDRLCGAVNYPYQMGKCEVTAGLYTAFLNAVAATDTYLLYNMSMWSDAYGCQILQSGSSGGFTYSVASDWANRPVNFVSWGDAARFANWLTNGQPTGNQDLSTTEDGSYYLNGAATGAQLLAVTRKANAQYLVPSEDEWYKAAYHKNDGVTGNYWDYPTGTDAAPSHHVVAPDPGNNANFYDEGWTIGAPYYRTEAGEFENSDSPYGTFDQAGNVWEWNEAIQYGLYRGIRGGSCNNNPDHLRASARNGISPTAESFTIGFRVAYVPEPATLSLLAVGGLMALARRRRK